MTTKSNLEGTVLSGMRPTGDLHIGHFEGVLRNWVELQENYDCFYFVADLHAVTTETDTRQLRRNTLEMVKDWLAFGIDPNKSTIFVQSYVPEHSELAVILERLINIGALERMPTFKAYVEHLAGDRRVKVPVSESSKETRELHGDERLEFIASSEVSTGFLTYPVLQAADILLYNTTHVPVGEDQLPHIELTREIARKFNRQYGELMVVPDALLSEAKRVRGIDGRKMSKSYGNEISPRHTTTEITEKVNRILTYRKRLTDLGDPFECPVYDLQKIFNKKEDLEILQDCRNASIRCYDCKMKLPDKISAVYEEYRAKRATISDDDVMQILVAGNLKARKVTSQKLDETKRFMLMNYLEEGRK
ncbi:MAG: tryptophan--tRNA ligase [archaeon]|nr:tryptophan--tRNA ligase [Nanoarchaeota archaeon]